MSWWRKLTDELEGTMEYERAVRQRALIRETVLLVGQLSKRVDELERLAAEEDGRDDAGQ